MVESTRTWRIAIVTLAVTGLLSVAVTPAYANYVPAPDQTVHVGTNNWDSTPRLSCTMDRLTVTTRGSNGHVSPVWSRVVYRDVNQQTYYTSLGWGYTKSADALGISTHSFVMDNRWVRVRNRSTGRDLFTYWGGTEFGFLKPGGHGSEVSVAVLEYQLNRNRGWEHRWVLLGRC